VQASRVSAGEEIQASPSPPDETTTTLVAIDLADAAFERECPIDELRNPRCARALEYVDDWHGAMGRDINALNLDPSSETSAELDKLSVILGFVAALGGLLSGGPTALAPDFPLIHGLLPVFGHLFVQGISEGATGRIDELRATVGRAEKLLTLALSAAESRRMTVG
jgi:hypothetical protein